MEANITPTKIRCINRWFLKTKWPVSTCQWNKRKSKTTSLLDPTILCVFFQHLTQHNAYGNSHLQPNCRGFVWLISWVSNGRPQLQGFITCFSWSNQGTCTALSDPLSPVLSSHTCRGTTAHKCHIRSRTRSSCTNRCKCHRGFRCALCHPRTHLQQPWISSSLSCHHLIAA